VSWLGADIGGTSARLGLFSELDPQALQQTTEFKICNDYERDLDTLIRSFRQLAGGQVIAGIGIGIPGHLSDDMSGLQSSAHLGDWCGHDLQADLESALDCRVVLENDADAGALAEAEFAGHDTDFWYLTWGTGIGGAVVTIGSEGYRLVGAEPGHHIISVDTGSVICACGRSGCFEAFVGGKGIEARTGRPAAEASAEIWEEVIGWMGIGIYNLIRIYRTPLLILGGGITEKQPQLVAGIETAANNLLGSYQQLEIRTPHFGSANNLYGALAMMSPAKSAEITNRSRQ